jgi:predicted N-formylglutamate amidohydrolase
MGASLLEGEEHPAIVVNGGGKSPYVLVCEHACNTLPRKLGTLGLSAEDMTRHIAWDIGAAPMAEALAKLIDAPLVLQRYSRLAYDCNRPPESADAMPETSEVFAIPGNRNLKPADRLARISEIYRPFQRAIEDLLDARAASGLPTILVTLHSFTPVYKGKARKVELGILHDRDMRLSSILIKSFPNIDARLNEPYGPKDGVLHLLNIHAAPRGLKHAMIEVRNDLITTERGQMEWAQRLSVPLIQAAAK